MPSTTWCSSDAVRWAQPACPATEIEWISVNEIELNNFLINIYGDPEHEISELIQSIAEYGVLTPLVVRQMSDRYQILSGNRRLSAARRLGLLTVPCYVSLDVVSTGQELLLLAYNRQRRKSFSQLMREADVFDRVYSEEARERRMRNLDRTARTSELDRRNSDDRGVVNDGRSGRTDAKIAKALGLGGKDLYRQARVVWGLACSGDPRALAAVRALDSGTKTIYSAYKDMRRRMRFTARFRPTPYDVWSFRNDTAFGVSHPGAIPAGIVAHLLHYYTRPGDLVVDPMAGGGTVVDVCESMGRRCLAFDLAPERADIRKNDVNSGFTSDCRNCDLIFVDPPYHTMKAGRYAISGIGDEPLVAWHRFLLRLAHSAQETLKPGGVLALLVANQTERDLPAGYGYLDHAFHAYEALRMAGFLPERRVSCPMSGGYLPQQVRTARQEGRMLGLVRDLLIMRKPIS